MLRPPCTAPFYHLKQDASDYPRTNFDYATLDDEGPTNVNEHVNVQADHYKLIQKIGEESNTLLKNTAGNKGLPITNATQRLGLIGDDAGDNPAGLTGCVSHGTHIDMARIRRDHTDIFLSLVCFLFSDNDRSSQGPFLNCFDVPADSALPNLPFYPNPTLNGTASTGGGSGSAYAPYVVSPLEAISLRARHTDMTIDYELNRDPAVWTYVDAVAGNVDKAIVFVSAFQSEAYDRKDLELAHNGSDLITRVAATCDDGAS